MLAEIYSWFTEGFDTTVPHPCQSAARNGTLRIFDYEVNRSCGAENPAGLKFCNECAAPFGDGGCS